MARGGGGVAAAALAAAPAAKTWPPAASRAYQRTHFAIPCAYLASTRPKPYVGLPPSCTAQLNYLAPRSICSPDRNQPAAGMSQRPPPPPPPPLFGVAALQLETKDVPTADNLAHIDALLDAECRRLGVVRWDDGQPAAAGNHSSSGGSSSSGGGIVHLDILVLPEVSSKSVSLHAKTKAMHWCG